MNTPTCNTHFITMSGSHGCIPDYYACFETHAQAVADLAEMFDLGRTRRTKLTRYNYLELQLSPIEEAQGRYGFGAEYCEIVSCNCATPEAHSDNF